MNTIKTTPRFINDTQVQVTKAFAKNARIFGTPEYKLWREIRLDCPNAEMIAKTIKRNCSKKVDTRNMTYANMRAFIEVQDTDNTLIIEFEKQIKMSKVQTNPYRYVLAWFMQKFQNYDSYKSYFENMTTADAVAA